MAERTSPRSILAVDFGSAHSHGALIEPVEGVYRLIAHADAPTVRAPQVDLLKSLRHCVARLEELAERPLLAPNGAPRTEHGRNSGVDAMILTVSAAPPLDCVVIGLTDELSLLGGMAACRASPASVRASIALAQGEDVRQQALASLRDAPPEVIILVGGVDGGPTGLLVEVASALAALFADVAPAQRPAILMAGNPEARRSIAQALGEGWDYDIVENVQPTLRAWQPQELQRELAQRYARLKLPQLAGYATLQEWAAAPILASDAGLGIVLQFLGRHRKGGQRVLGVDWGASQVRAALAADALTWSRRSAPKASPNLIAENEPWPLYIAAHGALAPALADLAAITGDKRATGWAVDLIAARGGPLSRSQATPWALLALLDAVGPSGATQIVLDWASLWPQLGALAQIEPLAALQVLLCDGLLEIGTVLSLAGPIRSGRQKPRLCLANTDNETSEIPIEWGRLQRLPLHQGASAMVEIASIQDSKRAAGPVEQVAVQGGELGLVVDARGRPLTLPQESAARRQAVEDWLAELL